MRRLVVVGTLLVSAAWLVLTAGPALGDGSGTVNATVQVQAAACITIAPQSFSYTPATFSSTGSLVVTTPPQGTTKPVVTSCSGGSQTFNARGGTTTGGAMWSLASSLTCPGSNQNINLYIHEVSSTQNGFIALTITNAQWEAGVQTGANRTLDMRLTMPCTGSAGLSQTVTIPVVITATVD